MKSETRMLRLLLAVVILAIVTACASMGRPEGGPRDTEPPLFVRSNPYPGQTNVNRRKVVIDFDENVQIKDIMTKVVISPAQQATPAISANGHRVSVELRDTLIPNTTYTIDFSDAISDLNEGNPIDGFAFAFSTGETIDSLQISGMVFEAETLEPAQGMLVGVYSDLSDTAITTLPFERITRTNQLGQYTLRNLKEGSYRIYAINDNNRDYHWDRSEDIAFYDVIITPTAESNLHNDTLKAQDGSDSIVVHNATKFGPNDILLTWFNENYRAQYLARNDRLDENRIYLEFGAPSDTLPLLTIINGPKANERLDLYTVLNASPTLDTLEYWLTDSILILQDSLQIEARYLRTDTLDQLSWTTDTLSLYMRGQRDKKKKEEEEKKKKAKKDEAADSVDAGPEITYVSLRMEGGSMQDVHLPFFFSTTIPVASFDSSAVHLQVLDDTTWIEVMPPEVHLPIPTRPMRYQVDYQWEPGAKYRFTIDSAAVYNIYGEWNKTFTHEFNVREESDYSSVTFNITGLTGPAVVQLLNSGDKPVASRTVDNGKVVFDHMMPNTYYARLFIDRNENGKYDSGSLLDSIQPEEVYYYSKKIPLKARWDAVQNWDINELPLDMQKPKDIKKNKPKPKPGEEPEEDEELEEDDNTFYAPGTINGTNNNNNNRTGNNRNQRNNTSRLRRNNVF